jgi:hypothetical protein
MMTVLVLVEVRPALSVATWLLRGGDDLRVTTRPCPTMPPNSASFYPVLWRLGPRLGPKY